MATIIDVPGERGLIAEFRDHNGTGEDRAGASITILIYDGIGAKAGAKPRVWCKPSSETTDCNYKKAPCSK